MTTRIVLARHGETLWNRSGRWQGHAPVPLSAQGRHQARLLAGRLLAVQGEVVAVHTSDLSRALETASIVADRLDKPVVTDRRFREIDLGEWQGLTMNETRAWDPERLEAVEMDMYNVSRPGGERPSEVASRVLAALDELADAYRGRTVVVVAHGGPIRYSLFSLGLLALTAPVVGNASCTVLAGDGPGEGPSTWRLELFNDVTHLDQPPVELEF
ncbi:MAG: histidine phosphatase family protein [Candidatus Riflebacteria bacterium]|nr:histidine phosphatase family protein [Candidatus Riflebacteria bacterium]